MFNPEGGQDTSVLTLVTRYGTHLGREIRMQKIQGESPLALTTADRHLRWHLQYENSGVFFQKALSASLSSSHLTGNAVSSSKIAD